MSKITSEDQTLRGPCTKCDTCRNLSFPCMLAGYTEPGCDGMGMDGGDMWEPLNEVKAATRAPLARQQTSEAADGQRKTIRSVRTDDDGRETTMPHLPTGEVASQTKQVESKSVNAANQAPSAALRLPHGLYQYSTPDGDVWSHARGVE